ncbi:uncharacterized protein [Chironomus tepperi]|uniref:uncharacterized protein n=1 Tax=Chironomus tepperi TaxID=113505 RepID=UPI00391F26CC
MASTKLFLIVLICLVPNVFSFWSSCPVGRLPLNVRSDLCNTDRCVVTRGERIVMEITLDFLEAHPTLRPRATMFFLGVGIQVPDVPGHDDVCPHLFSDGVFHGCPTAPGRVYDWVIDMTVPATLPAFQNGRMRVEILDGTRTVSCFEAVGAMI